MTTIVTMLVGICLTLAMGALILLIVFGQSGPNCPGMDPSYIGWCVERP